MHLPQIAALPKPAEDLAEHGRSAQPVPKGEGFLSVFSGDPGDRSSSADARPGTAPDDTAATSRAPGIAAADQPARAAGGAGDATRFAALQSRGDDPAAVSVPDRVASKVPALPGSGENADSGETDEVSETAEPPAEQGADIAPTWTQPLAALPEGTSRGPELVGITPRGSGAGNAGTPPVDLEQATPDRQAATQAVAGGGEPNRGVAGLGLAGDGSVSANGIGMSAEVENAARPAATGDQRPALNAADAEPAVQTTGIGPGDAYGRATLQRSSDGVTDLEGAENGTTTPGTTRPDESVGAKGTDEGQAGGSSGAQHIAGLPPVQPSETPGPRVEGRLAEAATAPPATGPGTAETAVSRGVSATGVPAGANREAGVPVPREISTTQRAGDGLFTVDAALAEATFTDARATARSPLVPVQPALHSADMARQAALQIAEVVRASGDRAVELKLQPEELGRVQLTLSQDAAGTLTVSLNAERPETLELLRRNIDLLGADLRDLGYESIDFSFQGDGTGGEPDTRSDWGDGRVGEVGADTPAGVTVQTGLRAASATGDGIDIRL